MAQETVGVQVKQSQVPWFAPSVRPPRCSWRTWLVQQPAVLQQARGQRGLQRGAHSLHVCSVLHTGSEGCRAGEQLEPRLLDQPTSTARAQGLAASDSSPWPWPTTTLLAAPGTRLLPACEFP